MNSYNQISLILYKGNFVPKKNIFERIYFEVSQLKLIVFEVADSIF